MKKQEISVRPTAYILFCLTGVLLVFCCLTGKDLAEAGNIVWTGAYTVKTLLISLFGGGALGGIICLLFGCFDAGLFSRKRTVKTPEKQQLNFAYSLLLIILAWLPAYLAYYPAICAYDMPVQTGQILEGIYIDHHPIAHTFLLKCFMELGSKIAGGVTFGIGLFAFLQMLFLAVSFACGVMALAKNGVGRIWLLLIQLWCMLYPFHWYMGVSLTKDTLFTGFFVLQMLVLYELLREKEKSQNRVWKEIFFILSTVGMMLFRNNGKYAFLVLLAILFLVFLFGKTDRRYFGRVLLVATAAFLLGNLVLSGIFRLADAEQGDKREMLSMPIQQLSRTMLYHGGVGVLAEDDASMEETDKALIRDFILNEAYQEYDPAISDPVKRNTNTYVVRYRAKEFLTTYLHLFADYPGDYLNAALAVNAGYLYPEDVSHAYINVTDERVGRGYVQTYWEEDTMNAHGIYKASKWEWLHEKLEQWADENAYLKLPLLKYLFVPGVWLWFYLFLLARLVMKKQYRQCIPLALVAGYFVTLFLGPTVQLRYLYPVMSIFPFVLFLNGGHDCAGSNVTGAESNERI